MSSVETAAPPRGLGAAGLELWNAIAGQVAGDGLVLDTRELRVLRDACRTADDVEVIEAALAAGEPMVLGSTGQPRVNPLFDESRKGRALIATLLKHISLDDPVEAPRRGAQSSTSARAAGLTRRYGSAFGPGA